MGVVILAQPENCRLSFMLSTAMPPAPFRRSFRFFRFFGDARATLVGVRASVAGGGGVSGDPPQCGDGPHLRRVILGESPLPATEVGSDDSPSWPAQEQPHSRQIVLTRFPRDLRGQTSNLCQLAAACTMGYADHRWKRLSGFVSGLPDHLGDGQARRIAACEAVRRPYQKSLFPGHHATNVLVIARGPGSHYVVRSRPDHR